MDDVLAGLDAGVLREAWGGGGDPGLPIIDADGTLSSSSSRSSLSSAAHPELVLVITRDGRRPSVPYYDEDTTADPVVYIDARNRAAWPVLAQLDVPLEQLPCVYYVRAPRSWLEQPRALSRRRIHMMKL